MASRDMIQRLKWVCEKCGWDTGEIEYHPSPENMDAMLAGLMPKHGEESPDCIWDTGRVKVFHISGAKNHLTLKQWVSEINKCI